MRYFLILLAGVVLAAPHTYKPGEPRPTSFWVECDTVSYERWTRNDTVILIAETPLCFKVSWDCELPGGGEIYQFDSVICDTHFIYPIEYEPVVKCDTAGYIRYYTVEGRKIVLDDNQDVNATIYKDPVLKCDTVYERKP